MGNPDVLARPEPAGIVPAIGRDESFSGVVAGRTSWHFLPRAPENPKSMWWINPAGTFIASPARYKADVSPSGTGRPGRRSRGPAAAPTCRRFTPWRMEPTSSASPIRATRSRPRGLRTDSFCLFVDAPLRPGRAGAQDLYLMDVASKQWVQLTHEGGRNDFPSLVAGWAAHRFSVQPFRSLSKSGRCWLTAAIRSSSRLQVTTLSRTGVGNRFFVVTKLRCLVSQEDVVQPGQRKSRAP